VTVAAARVTLSPPQPWVDLDLDIVNAGPYRAWLEPAPFGNLELRERSASGVVEESATGPRALAPHATTTVRLRATATNCEGLASWQADGALSDASTTTMETIGLAATAVPPTASGAGPSPAPSDTGPDVLWGEGVGPSGVLFEPSARAAMAPALAHLCAGLGAVVTRVDDVTVDRSRRTATLTLTVDVTPGLVRELRIRPDSEGAPGALTPAWSTPIRVAPDRTGAAVVMLPFRGPEDRCESVTPDALATYPAAISLVAIVPTPQGERSVPFTEWTTVEAFSSRLVELCG
jgi:hypothetical protein